MEQSVVADMYRINRVNGKYENSNNKLLIRKGMKITAEYFEQVNEETESNGLCFVKDEEATKERNEYLTAKLNGDAPIKKAAVSSEVEELRAAYKELTGKEANKLWKEGKLTSEIELLTKED